MNTHFSVQQQKELARKLGLNPDEFDPNDQITVDKFFRVMVAAQLSGEDIYGKPLTKNDFSLLHTLTGRG